jgi:hypothetical protein
MSVPIHQIALNDMLEPHNLSIHYRSQLQGGKYKKKKKKSDIYEK